MTAGADDANGAQRSLRALESERMALTEDILYGYTRVDFSW